MSIKKVKQISLFQFPSRCDNTVGIPNADSVDSSASALLYRETEPSTHTSQKRHIPAYSLKFVDEIRFNGRPAAEILLEIASNPRGFP